MASRKEYATIKECLDAGNKWQDCVGFEVSKDGEMKNVIKNTCPRVMRDELQKKVFSGRKVIFSAQEEDASTPE